MSRAETTRIRSPRIVQTRNNLRPPSVRPRMWMRSSICECLESGTATIVGRDLAAGRAPGSALADLDHRFVEVVGVARSPRAYPGLDDAVAHQGRARHVDPDRFESGRRRDLREMGLVLEEALLHDAGGRAR